MYAVCTSIWVLGFVACVYHVRINPHTPIYFKPLQVSYYSECTNRTTEEILFDSQQEEDIFLFPQESRLVLGSKQPHISEYRSIPSGDKVARGVKLTTHVHLLPRLRMSGYIPFLLQCLHGVNNANFTILPVYLRSILIQSTHLRYLRLSLNFLTKISNSLLISSTFTTYPAHFISVSQ